MRSRVGWGEILRLSLLHQHRHQGKHAGSGSRAGTECRQGDGTVTCLAGESLCREEVEGKMMIDNGVGTE